MSNKNIFATLVSFVSCPCHIPIWLGLTAGTTLGVWLASHTGNFNS